MAEPITCAKCGVASAGPLPGGLCHRCGPRGATGIIDPPPAPEPNTIRIDPADLCDDAVHGGISRANGDHAATLLFRDYELIEEIARGGMGVVYKARQISLNRVVAVKVILSGQFVDEQSIQRFRAEAEAAANLHHPNIIAIYEIGEEDDQHFFSMEFVEGRTLTSLVREQALPAKRAAQYLKTIAEAIEYAHQHDILHRDLKPSNVLVDVEGRLCIGDFGLAKRISGQSQLTISGQILGTPSYMAPEQATGKRGEVGRHSDVYGLGAILYHLTTGRPPFMAENMHDTLVQVLQCDPPALRLLNPKIPRDLETICLKCLEKDPLKRYASAQEVADDLGRFLATEPIRARPVGFFGRSWRWCRRKPALAAVGAVAILLLGVIAIGSPIAAFRLNAARVDAQQRELKAVRNEQKALRNAYGADMAVAQQAINLRNYGYALQLLEAHRPAPGQPDARGWEWRYLWDQCRSEGVTNLATHKGEVYAVRVSPHGNFVASIDSTGTFKVTGLADGRPILEVERAGGSRPVFSPDEQMVAVQVGDQARFWNLATRQELPSLATGRGVQDIAFHPRLPRLIARGSGHFRTWDLEKRAQVEDEAAPPEGAQKIATLSADCQWMAASLDNRHVVIWHHGQGTNQIIDTKHVPAGGQPIRLGLSPDGKWLACAVALGAGKEFWIQIWDVASARQVTNLAAHINYVGSVEFSPDQQFLGSSSYDQTAEVWSTRTWQRIAILKGHQALVDNLSFVPDRPAVVTGSTDRTVKLWSFQDAHAEASLPLPKSLTHELISEYLGGASPDYRVLVMLQPDATGRQSDGTGVLVDAAKLQVIKELALPWTNITKVAVANDGALLALGRSRGDVVIWNPGTSSPAGELALPGQKRLRRLMFSPRAEWLAGSTSDNRFQLWNVKEKTPRWSSAATNIVAFAFSPDGGRIALGHKDGAISLLESATGTPVLSLPGHSLEINNVAFSPDGRRLSSTSWDGTARVWDLKSRLEVARFRGSQSSFFRVSFSPDGSRLFVNEWDSAFLFDIEGQRQVAQLKTYVPAFLDADTVLGFGETELWRLRPHRLADIDMLK